MLTGRLPRCLFAVADELAGSAGAAAPAASAPSERAVLDGEALHQLRDLDPTGANHLLERVFHAFETSTGRLMPQMRAAQRSDDNAVVRHVVHTLKSSSASIGATRLSQLCAEIETMIREGRLDDLPLRLEQMDRETAAVLRVLRKMAAVPS